MKSEVQILLDENADEQQRSDSVKLLEIMHDATGAQPALWGKIIGFGKYHYKYETGREGDTVAVGFAARKNALVLYGIIDYDQSADGLSGLGKYTLGKGCLYIKKLSDINMDALAAMIAKAYTLRNNSP